jgi:hypothetical protein
VEVSKLVLEGDGYEQGFFDHPFLFLSSIHQSEQVGQCFFGSDAILFVLFMEGKTLEHLDKKHFLHEGVFLSSNLME